MPVMYAIQATVNKENKEKHFELILMLYAYVIIIFT